MTTSKHVNTPGAAYNQRIGIWQTANALMAGTQAMRDAGEIYIPKERGESDDDYKKRLQRCWLFAAFAYTVDTMAAKPVEKDIGINAPEAVKAWAADVDRAGSRLDVFALNAMVQVLAKGHAYILVEYPNVEKIKQQANKETLTLQDETDLGLRPYAILIKPEDLIDFDYEVRGGTPVLTTVRIRERVLEKAKDDPFQKVSATQVRVLYEGRYEIWRQKEKSEDWVIFEEGPRSLQEIPIIPVYGLMESFMIGKPLLKPLMEKNIEHWQSACDQRNILHVARVPILFGKKLDGFGNAGKPAVKAFTETGADVDEKTAIGSGAFFHASSDGGDLQYVEISGSGSIEAGARDLETIKEEMMALGAQITAAQQSGGKTATENVLKSAKGNSLLHLVIANMEAALEAMFALMQRYAGKATATVAIDLYTDFDLSDGTYMSAADVLSAVNSKLISHKSFISLVNARGVFPEPINFDDETSQIETEIGNLTDRLPATSGGFGSGGQ